jgi:hypothetical protein
MPAKKPKPDEKPQRERFIEAAREIGADETQEGFEKAFKRVVPTETDQKSPVAKKGR